MFAINILSAINALNISTMHPTTVAEFHIENGVIQPYLSSIREHNFSVFGITRSLYENYVSTILSLYFDSIQLSNNLSAEDFKTSRDLFYSDLKLLVHSILDETFKITEIFPSVSTRDEFESQCLAIVSISVKKRPVMYSTVPKSLIDFTSWVEHYFFIHASSVALIPLPERQRLDSITKLNARISRLTSSESTISQEMESVKSSLDILKMQGSSPKKILPKEKAVQNIQKELSLIQQNKKSAQEQLSLLLNQGIGFSSSLDTSSPSLSIQFHNMTDTLYIHKGVIKCTRNHHTIICVNAVVQTVTNQSIPLNVNYCTSCKRFFLSYEEYNHYLNKYRTILSKIHFIPCPDSKNFSKFLAEESPLKLCGYSVSQEKGLTKSEREKLLSALITNNIMSKSDIIQYLNWFIQANGQRFGNNIAREKWQSDLAFVRDFNKSAQSNHVISIIKPYSQK